MTGLLLSAAMVGAILTAFVHGNITGRRQGRMDLLDHLARQVEGGS